MAAPDDWLAEALDTYRDGRQKLELWKDDPRENVQIYVEDLREMLLDLKQATIARDRSRVVAAIIEISLLLADLNDFEEPR